MKRFLVGIILVGMMVGTANAGPYVVCVKRYQKNLGEINATDYRGRSIDGTIDQECVDCHNEAIVWSDTGNWNDACSRLGLPGFNAVIFSSLAEANLFGMP